MPMLCHSETTDEAVRQILAMLLQETEEGEERMFSGHRAPNIIGA